MHCTTHAPVFSKVRHSWTVLLCHLWIFASSEPSYTQTVCTQLLPILTTFCIPFPLRSVTKCLLTVVGKQNSVKILDVYEGDIHDFSLFWLPILMPSFGCFMTGSCRCEWDKIAVSQLAALYCHCAEHLVQMCLTLSEVDCFRNSFRHFMYAMLLKTVSILLK